MRTQVRKNLALSRRPAVRNRFFSATAGIGPRPPDPISVPGVLQYQWPSEKPVRFQVRDGTDCLLDVIQPLWLELTSIDGSALCFFRTGKRIALGCVTHLTTAEFVDSGRIFIPAPDAERERGWILSTLVNQSVNFLAQSGCGIHLRASLSSPLPVSRTELPSLTF